MFTPRDPRRHCALGAFAIAGIVAVEVARSLMNEHRIFTVVRRIGDQDVVRVTPHLYTSVAEIDRLVAAIQALAGAITAA